ncbi:arginyl-tRNA synthetase [Halovivax ruber XH-70]|uniref:Arginine--tRNA ligase n=1 Tax=Halovivax ruber (strain DSM 18193 / JCM 13892 / XH-70) TaxID=797302 RepID=L0IE82_HALRX|nr:arginine--tRNA ligase [Halovivax ruber]AGB17148.1 arginyl-tRNA synthetase [Halovivax ruber XH-70]
MFPALRDEVASALDAALSARELPTDDLGIEEPPDDVDSVLASSVAFRLAGEVGAAPPQVAAELADEIDVDELRYVDRVETQGPYVNFLPSPTYYAETVEAATADDYGHRPDRDESVVVEHTSANPTGPVHVGRARNPIIGDAVATLLSYAGYDVDRHYYVNDAGRQMAVFTWAYETFDEAELDREPDRNRIEYDLVRYYREGNAFLENGPDDEVAAAEAEIESIMQGLEAGDEATYERVSEVVDQVLSGMQECLARLPAEFDEFVKETRFMRDGSTDDIVARLQDSEVAEREEDAWQLDLEAWGIDKSFVFLRSDGTSLYTTRDLAHHEWKFERFDRAVTVLGEDQELHARQLAAALEVLGNDTHQLTSMFYGWVNLPGGEGMSTREGTGIDLDDLLDEAIDRAREEVEDRLDDRIRDDDLTEDDIDRIARQVGIGAVRYDIVAKQPTKAITFEWDRALDFEAQSAPYVQYVHARCCGILEEAGLDPGNAQDGLATTIDTDALATDAERDLIETIGRFPWEIEEAADDLEPHRIATYTREFAETFNAFYRECPVLADDVDTDTRDARLALVAASKHTMANALDVLGVAPPRSM